MDTSYEDPFNDLCAMIKITDIQRMQAYHNGDNMQYKSLNERYDYLTEQYFEMIKTHNHTEAELISAEVTIELNKGKLNYQQLYGKR